MNGGEKRLTRHDLGRLAKGLLRAQPEVRAARLGWRRAVEAVADFCEGMNPKFNRERFVAGCYGAERRSA